MISELAGLQQLVAFTFILVFFGMLAGSIFFMMEKDRVAPEFRQSVVVAALVCGIAALSYYYMKDIYLAGTSTGSSQFPTAFRYIDWVLTVPLMITKFPSLLGLGARGRQIIITLVSLTVVMILTGYIGEINAENTAIHLGFWGIGMVAGAAVFALLFLAMRELPEKLDPIVRKTIMSMFALVLIGWMVYPIGYLAPSFGLAPEMRELVYNIADLTNKVGLGLIVYFGGRRMLLSQNASAQIVHPRNEQQAAVATTGADADLPAWSTRD